MHDLIAMLTACAELCQATANSMLRGSALHPVLCRACAEACDLCAAAFSWSRTSRIRTIASCVSVSLSRILRCRSNRF